jgi:FAD-dependent urate hydroxylase
MKADPSVNVAIIGAGPYGLAAAAHLRVADVETRVFGEVMEFWDKQMPVGMCLRSQWAASHIGYPGRGLTLDEFEASENCHISKPIPLERFIKYGRWFQRRVVPDVDRRRVALIERGWKGFRLRLDDGEAVLARRVVVAAGISRFGWRPPQFDGLPKELASHSAEQCDLRHFSGRRIGVVGGGQSALEAAALLHEAGAEVEVIVRQERIRWLDQRAGWLKSERNPLRSLLYPPTDVGPPILNQIVGAPDLFRRLPHAIRERIAYRSIRPAGADWLVDRLRDVPILTSRVVESVTRAGNRIELKLDDATRRNVDHVLLCTGYRVDISRYGFLPPDLLSSLGITDGYPLLTAGFESSQRGLHFIGAAAARSYGPLCRFVSGTPFTGRALARCIAGGHAVERPLEEVDDVGLHLNTRRNAVASVASEGESR